VLGNVGAEPFVPADGEQVLERLRSSGLASEGRELRELRRQLNMDPTNLTLAQQCAYQCIERARSDSDPRYLGRAQAAMLPWWNATAIPANALVIRAILKQSQHDFTNALSDLQLALARDPRNAQAWLTRSTILTVLGDYIGARRACVPLAQLAPGLIALTAAANVACLNGDAEHGCALLRTALHDNPNTPKSEQVWALTILAETQARLGHQGEAEESFKRALQLEPRDIYLQCAYADLLLDLDRAREAAESLLKNSMLSDAVLLRLALAEAQESPPGAHLPMHVSMLRARFEEGQLRGDFVHQREEARFLLALDGNSTGALKLARLNWQVQHEPADARILLESALAQHDAKAALPALEFIGASHIEDSHLAFLTDQLKDLQNP
jgi:predicted Zn-dependent protease